MDLGPPVILIVEVDKREVRHFADNERQCEIVVRALNRLGEAEAWCFPRVKSFLRLSRATILRLEIAREVARM
jgi:hypothetical protein